MPQPSEMFRATPRAASGYGVQDGSLPAGTHDLHWDDHNEEQQKPPSLREDSKTNT